MTEDASAEDVATVGAGTVGAEKEVVAEKSIYAYDVGAKEMVGVEKDMGAEKEVVGAGTVGAKRDVGAKEMVGSEAVAVAGFTRTGKYIINHVLLDTNTHTHIHSKEQPPGGA